MSALKVRDDPLEGSLIGVAVARVFIRDRVAILALGVQQVVECTLWEIAQRCLWVPLVRLHRCGDHLQVPAPLWRAGPRDEAAGEHRLLRINHALLINLEAEAETGAGFAGAMRGVKAERTRLQIINHRAVVGAAELLAEESLFKGRLLLLGGCWGNNGEPLSQLNCRLYGVGKPAAIGDRKWLPLLVNGVLDNKAVDDDLNGVALLLVKLRQIIGTEVVLHAVHAHAAESGLPRRLIHALPLALAIAQEWAEHEDACAIRELENLFNDLVE